MDGKVVLVTGSNAGIGFETAKALALQGAKVVMACRSEQRGMKAMEEIKAAGLKDGRDCDVDLMTMDLSSLASVRKFADQFSSKYDKLDCLINNAGIMAVPYLLTGDGFESQFQVNHLSHYLLSRRLRPLLEKSDRDPSIIHVSSRASEIKSLAEIKKGHFLAMATPVLSEYDPWKAYCQSKLAQVLLMKEMDRKIGSKIRVNAVHPGVVATELFDKSTWPWLFRPLIPRMFQLGVMMRIISTPAEGAATSIYLATNPREVTGSGGYFKRSKRVSPNPVAEDHELCREVWNESAVLVGMEP